MFRFPPALARPVALALLVFTVVCLAARGQEPVNAAALAPASAAPAAVATDPWLETLSALLTERYQAAGELRLAYVRPRPDAAPVDADLQIVSAPAELAPQILVNVRATDAAGRASDHTLILRAELWREGCVLREPATVGTALAADSVEARRFDALRERDALPAASIGELDFARNVPAGRLLAWRDVIRRPLVRRGQTVDVSATDGTLTVTLRAVALHDAARGEAVRLRNPDSKKDITATVVAESRAAVRF